MKNKKLDKAYRFWSLHFVTFNAIAAGTFLAFPDAVLSAWAMLPAELKAVIPAGFMPFVAVLVFAVSVMARLAHIEKTNRKNDDDK